MSQSIITPVVMHKQHVRADKIATVQFDRANDLRWLKMDLSEIARMRREGIVSKAQAKHMREDAISAYVGMGYSVQVLPNGAITFA